MTKIDREAVDARLAILPNVPALSFADVTQLLGLPTHTMETLRRNGRGPRCFMIGKRLYVRQSDLRAWIDELVTNPDA